MKLLHLDLLSLLLDMFEQRIHVSLVFLIQQYKIYLICYLIEKWLELFLFQNYVI